MISVEEANLGPILPHRRNREVANLNDKHRYPEQISAQLMPWMILCIECQRLAKSAKEPGAAGNASAERSDARYRRAVIMPLHASLVVDDELPVLVKSFLKTILPQLLCLRYVVC